MKPFEPLIERKQMTAFHLSSNLESKVVRCFLDKEIGSDGTYLTYFPFEPMIERKQMTAFHSKFRSCMCM